MSVVDTINATAQTLQTDSRDAIGSNELGKDEFTRLLLAQLQNQDPTEPTDSQAFVAQLAEFSGLEQLQAVNGTLDELLLAQNNSDRVAAGSYVGQWTVFNTDTVDVDRTGQAAPHPTDARRIFGERSGGGLESEW